jgi:hypothetical protein
LYGLNINAPAVRLSGDVDSATSTLSINQMIENDSSFSVPVYLAIEGELVVCESKIGNIFSSCLRGAEGTTPRPHPSGSLVNLAVVRLQDGQGNLVQGSADLAIIGDWNDHLYFNRYPNDLMSKHGATSVYEQHSAFAWNRIAGQRPLCGNYNAPCNIGEYLNDIPQHNILEIHAKNGQPATGARVEVYQAKPLSVWYGKVFLNVPDVVYFTNAQGRVDLGSFPFGTEPITHTFGHSNALILLKIVYEGRTIYRFFEITEANEAYWSGYQGTAIYVIAFDNYIYLPLITKR